MVNTGYWIKDKGCPAFSGILQRRINLRCAPTGFSYWCSACGAGGGAPKDLAAYAEAPAFARLWRRDTSCQGA